MFNHQNLYDNENYHVDNDDDDDDDYDNNNDYIKINIIFCQILIENLRKYVRAQKPYEKRSP